MEKLKKNLDDAVASLREAETAFLEAKAQGDHARNTASATHTLKAKAEVETATDQILERSALVEAALESYRQQIESDYHSEMEAATVETRRLHARRLELEAEMKDLAKRIEVATEAERPAVDKAVGKQNFHVQYANTANLYKIDVVRLTQAAAA